MNTGYDEHILSLIRTYTIVNCSSWDKQPWHLEPESVQVISELEKRGYPCDILNLWIQEIVFLALHTAKNTEQSEFLLPLKEDDDSLLGDSDKAELTDKVETGHLVTELSRMNISEFSEEFLASLPTQTRRIIRWF